MRQKLHILFEQYHRNFETFSRVKDYSSRQNLLKLQEANYRRFQVQCVKINNSEIREKEYSSLQGVFDETQTKETLAGTLLQGLLNHCINEARMMERRVLENQGIQFDEVNLKKKANPFILREQDFFTNQKKKEKIDMKPFIL